MASRFQLKVRILEDNAAEEILTIATAGSALIQACEKAGVTIPR
jgi:hypothetical protein